MPTSQKGFTYVLLAVMIFLVLMAILMIPRDLPKIHVEKKCELGEPPAEEKILTLPGIKFRNTLIPPPEAGTPDESDPHQYKLIRINVPTKNNILPITNIRYFNFSTAINLEGHSTLYTKSSPVKGQLIFYPNKYGEIDFYREFTSDKYNTVMSYGPQAGVKNQIIVRQEGILFFVHVDEDNQPIITGDNILTTDWYQDVDLLNDPNKGYSADEFFNCPSSTVFGTSTVGLTIPAQSPSTTKEQLQLEWFLFGQGFKYIQPHCKPAIYLYPQDKTLVNVKVKTTGFLTYVDPPYPGEGWNVWAYPDGNLSTTSNLTPKAYPYLYYESKVPDALINKPDKGWVVSYDQLESLYREVLPKLGLNQQQTQDFISYWTKALKNDSPYYFVGVMDQQNINQIEPLEITPKPDSVNRVRLYFERLDQPKEVQAPDLGSWNLNPGSSTFRVVEWGGMVKNDLTHPFTCSQ